MASRIECLRCGHDRCAVFGECGMSFEFEGHYPYGCSRRRSCVKGIRVHEYRIAETMITRKTTVTDGTGTVTAETNARKSP